jgi:peptide/nickel transport system substrate-binding protein
MPDTSGFAAFGRRMRLSRTVWRAIAGFGALTAVAAAQPARAAPCTPSADGADLVIGVADAADTLDPQLRNRAANFSVARHIFEPLVDQDRSQRLEPGLARAWEPSGAAAWRFHLRDNVRFHDGTALTAAAVAAALRRPNKMPPSPGSYVGYVRAITDITIEDPLTLVVHTAGPWPLLPTDLSTILIVRRADASSAAFDDGSAVIGTGPYRFADWTRGGVIHLCANDAYWGGTPAWRSVEFRTIPDGAARVAALRAGDVALIDYVPSPAVQALRGQPGIAVADAVSNRLLFLQVDTRRPVTPGARSRDGAALAGNPLRDPRVRRAISLGIDRATIAGAVLEGEAAPAGQLLPDGYPDASPELPPPPFAPDTARRLLADAGYPDGIALTLTVPVDRFVNDKRVGVAAAQTLDRSGFAMTLDPLPGSIVLSRMRDGAVSALLWGWSSETGEASGPLRAILASPDAARGWGAANRLDYRNPALDALLADALGASDDAVRRRLLRSATELAVSDGGLIPIIFLRTVWASRRPVTYRPNAVGWTFAWDAGQ